MTDQTNNVPLSGRNSPAPASNQTQTPILNKPSVIVRVHGGIDLETRVVHRPDGSIIVNVSLRPIQANANVLPAGAAFSMLDRNLHGGSNLTGPLTQFHSFRVPGNVANEQQVGTHPFPGRLPRSDRIWNFATAVGSGTVNDLDPSTPPPTYQEAILSPRHEVLDYQPHVDLATPVVNVMREGPYSIDGITVTSEEWVSHVEDSLHQILGIGGYRHVPALNASAAASTSASPFSPASAPTPDLFPLPLAGQFEIFGEDVLPERPSQRDTIDDSPPMPHAPQIQPELCDYSSIEMLDIGLSGPPLN